MSARGPRPSRSDGVLTSFQADSDEQDLVNQMRNGGLTARQAEQRFGFTVVRTGVHLVNGASSTMQNQENQVYNANQGYQPQDPQTIHAINHKLFLLVSHKRKKEMMIQTISTFHRIEWVGKFLF